MASERKDKLRRSTRECVLSNVSENLYAESDINDKLFLYGADMANIQDCCIHEQPMIDNDYRKGLWLAPLIS